MPECHLHGAGEMFTRLSIPLVVFTLACAARPDRPPSLTHEPVKVNQGEALTVPLSPQDPDGDAVTITRVLAPEHLHAVLDGGALTLRPDYALSDSQVVELDLDDGVGAQPCASLAVTVAPLGWQWKVDVDASGPSAREHASFIYDATHDVAYMIGGSGYVPQGTPATDPFWTLDLKSHTFAPLAAMGTLPKPAASRRVANLPEKRIAYLFAGYDSNTTEVNELYSFDYSGDAPVFAEVKQMNAPPARELHVFAYDPGSDTFVVFGGFNATVGLLNDTWTMKLGNDGAEWTRLTGDGPGGRYGAFYAMDPSLGRLYLWSGAQAPSAGNPINATQDLWVLDLRASPSAWLRLMSGTENGTPTGRRNGAFVLNPHGPRLFVFGGTADGATTVPGVSVLDLSLTPPVWTTLSPSDMPPPRSSAFGFYDELRAQAVMGFGNDRMRFRDMFALGY
jgi:hypothetical protein